MFSGYISDVEGTFVDTVPQSLRSLQEALEQAGFTIPYATLQLYPGLDDDQTLQIIGLSLGSFAPIPRAGACPYLSAAAIFCAAASLRRGA
jgi:beta-phosphoglucomutase-like phosphatase (HAD superfamily)